MGRNRIFLLLGAATVGLVLLACSHTSESTHEASVAQPPMRPAKSRAVRPVVDVPALLALTIDELPARLGPPGRVPDTFVDPSVVALNEIQARIDSTAFFRYRGQAFVVSYNTKTRQLYDVLLLGRDENVLRQRGKLTENAAGYLLVPVFEVRDITALQGLRVIPAGVERPQ